MALGHGFLKKLNRVAAAVLAAVLIAGTASVPVKAAANSDRVMGFDDYLNNTSGVDYFGHELNMADADVANAQKVLDKLEKIINATETRGRHSYNADRRINSTLLDDEMRALIEEKTVLFGKKKSITLLSVGFKAFGSGEFTTIPVDEWMNWSKYVNSVTLKRDNLKEYIEKQTKNADGLRTIYRGFAVIGNVKTPTNPTGKTFSVGNLSGGTVFDQFEENLKTKGLYNDNASYDKAIDDSSEPGKFERMIAEPIGNGAFDLYLWLANWNVDLTMDGLIFGRVSPSYKGNVDFTHFGLEENNPYGIISAAAYYVLRRILLSVLPIIMMVVLLRQLFQNGQKGRAHLKEMAGNFVIAMILSFVAPYVIELCIVARDAILKSVSLGMGAILSGAKLGGGVGSNVIGLVYITYKRNPSLLNALVWAASVGAGLVYLVSYLQIALLLTGAVAVLPIVLFISIWNPKILKDWWNVFFPNLCVPLVDLILLQVPSIFLLLFKAKYNGGTNFGGSAIVLGILIIILMWNSLMIRDRVIRILGFEGFNRRGGGFVAAAAAFMMRAARDVRRGVGRAAGDGRGGGEDGGREDRHGDRDVNRDRGALQEEALKGIGGSDVPGGEQQFDPMLGDNTDDFLKELDNEYGVGGRRDDETAGMEMADGEAAEGEMPEGGEPGEMPDGGEMPAEGEGGADGELPEGEGANGLGDFDGEGAGEETDGEGARDNGTVGEFPDGEGGAEGEMPEGGVMPGGDALGEGVPSEEGAEKTGAAAAAAVTGGSAVLTAAAEPDGFTASSEHPQRLALDQQIDAPKFDEKTYEGLKGKEKELTEGIDRWEGKLQNMDRSDSGYKAAASVRDSLIEEREGVRERLAMHEFRNGLGTEAAKGRFENLTRMDAYNDKIRANEREMASLGYSRDSYDKDRRSYLDSEKQLSAHVGASRERLAGLTAGTQEYAVERGNLQKMERARSEVHSRIEQLDRGAGLDKANNAYREEVARMTQTEQSYARAWKVGGMSDRTYQSASDYQFQTKIDDAHKKLATYRDFDSKRYDGILTPAEKEDFYREREVHEARERAVRVASGVASRVGGVAHVATSVGVGALAATYGAYGGANTMADIGMVTGGGTWMAGSYAGRGASAIGRGLGRAYVDRPVRNISRVPSGGSTTVNTPSPSGNEGGRSHSPSGGSSTGGSPTGSGRSSARDLSRSADYKVTPRPQKQAVNNGTGKASADTLARNAERKNAGRNNDRPQKGNGNAGPNVMARNAERKHGGGNNSRPVKGNGKASPNVMANNAEGGRKDDRPKNGSGKASAETLGRNSEGVKENKNGSGDGK